MLPFELAIRGVVPRCQKPQDAAGVLMKECQLLVGHPADWCHNQDERQVPARGELHGERLYSRVVRGR